MDDIFYSAISLTDWDPLLLSKSEQYNDRKKFASKMRECVEACLVLCDHVDAVNELGLWLLNLSLCLTGCCGDCGELVISLASISNFKLSSSLATCNLVNVIWVSFPDMVTCYFPVWWCRDITLYYLFLPFCPPYPVSSFRNLSIVYPF